MFLSTFPTLMFAVSRPQDWQLTAMAGDFVSILQDKGIVGIGVSLFTFNSDRNRDHRHNCPNHLLPIEEQPYSKRGRCRAIFAVPK